MQKAIATNESNEFKKVVKGDIWKPYYSQIEIDPELNLRKDYADIEELAENIKENGVKMPLSGYRKGDKFVPVDGHRRTAACKILFDRDGIDIQMPFMIETKGTNAEQRIIDMFIKNEGKPLNPLEMAEGIKRLLAYGWKEKEIAAKLSKSEGYIRKLNSLNSAPKLFTNLIVEGVISSTFAIGKIADRGVEEFMTDYESGKFTKNSSQQDEEGSGTPDNSVGGGFFEFDKSESVPKTPVKITNKTVDKLNSIKEFKKLAKAIDTSEFNDQQTVLFNTLQKVIDNEYTGEDLLEIFSAA